MAKYTSGRVAMQGLSYFEPLLPILIVLGFLGLAGSWRRSAGGRKPWLVTICVVGIFLLSTYVESRKIPTTQIVTSHGFRPPAERRHDPARPRKPKTMRIGNNGSKYDNPCIATLPEVYFAIAEAEPFSARP